MCINIKKIVLFSTFIVSFVMPNTICYGKEPSEEFYISFPSNFIETQTEEKNVIYHGESKADNLEAQIYSVRNLKTNKIHNLKSMSLSELETQAQETVLNQEEDSPVKIKGWKILETEDIVFLVFDGTILAEDNSKQYITQYMTIVNGGSLQITFYSDDSFTNAQDEIIKDVISSIKFTNITEPSIDKKIIIELSVIFIGIILLIGSVIWHIKRYRRRYIRNGQKRRD